MPIDPPSLPSTAIGESTYADDASLAIQTIAAEQAISGLQTLGNSAQLLENLASRQQAAIDISSQIVEGRGRVQQAELSEARSVRDQVAAAVGNDEEPANAQQLESFLSSRGLPSDLGSTRGRQAAQDALNNYVGRVEDNFDAVDNPGVRGRIAADSDLQLAVDRSNEYLSAPADRTSPAGLADTQLRLEQRISEIGVQLRSQLQAFTQDAGQAAFLSQANSQLGSQLAGAVVQSQAVATVRADAAAREINDRTVELNQVIRDLDLLLTTDANQIEVNRLATELDRLNTTADRLRDAYLVLAPGATVDSRAAPTGPSRGPDTRQALEQGDAVRPRFRDPSRLV